MSGIDDPRGREVDELAWQAEQQQRSGDLERATGLFARAAAIEESIAEAATSQPPRVRSVLAVSAVALWYKAAQWQHAEVLAHRYLAQPDHLTAEAHDELRELLERTMWEGLRQKVQEGLASGPAIPATDEFWQSLRRHPPIDA